MTLGQRLRQLDALVEGGRSRWWFLAALVVVLLGFAVAAATNGLTRLAAGLLTPALVAVGVVLGSRWQRRR